MDISNAILAYVELLSETKKLGKYEYVSKCIITERVNQMYFPNSNSNSNFKSHILTNAVGENIPNSFILDNDKNLKSQYIHIKCIISLRADNRQIALQETFLSQEGFLQCKVPLVDEVL